MGIKLEQTYDSIAAALFGATRQGVLRIFFTHPDQRFYQRQIIRMLRAGSGAVQRELANLTGAGILTRTIEGSQNYYQANRNSPVFAELREFVRKTFGVTGVLRQALKSLAGSIKVAFIHGSVAVGRENARSDVDVIIVGDVISLDEVVAALHEAEETLGREINPSVYSTGEFCRKIAAGHHFLSSVLAREKIFLIGSESELTELVRVRVVDQTPDESARNRGPIRSRGSRS